MFVHYLVPIRDRDPSPKEENQEATVVLPKSGEYRSRIQ